MSDNQEVEVIAEVPAPATEVTTATEPDAQVVEMSEEKPAEASKVFTQEELDAAIGKRLAREQRKWEREQRASQAATPMSTAELPAPDQFETVEAYADALALQKAENLIAQREQQRQQVEILESYHDREEEARAKYDDFEQVAYNPSVPITQVMAQTIQASETGPDIAYYLGANVKEADRISKLPAMLQAKEIGRLEAKLANEPVVKKTTSAPAPITPVTAKGSGSPAYDTTDPRSTKTMSTSDWIAAERARQLKAYEARNR
jgi:hypothetical protein